MIDPVVQSTFIAPPLSEAAPIATSKTASDHNAASHKHFVSVLVSSQEKEFPRNGEARDDEHGQAGVDEGLDRASLGVPQIAQQSLMSANGQLQSSNGSRRPSNTQTQRLAGESLSLRIGIASEHQSGGTTVSGRGRAPAVELPPSQALRGKVNLSKDMAEPTAHVHLSNIEKLVSLSTDLSSNERRLGPHDRHLTAPLLHARDSNQPGVQDASSLNTHLGARIATARPLDETDNVSLIDAVISPKSAPVSRLALEGLHGEQQENGTRSSLDVSHAGTLTQQGDRSGQEEVSSPFNRQGEEPSRDAFSGQAFMNHSHAKASPTKEGPQASVIGMAVNGERPSSLSVSGSHRLQLEVPLSQTSMLHLDVSVQQRHVSASVMLDHPLIRHMAIHHVSELEEQLNHMGLHLREFDAQADSRSGNDASFADDNTSSAWHAERHATPSARPAAIHLSSPNRAASLNEAGSRLHIVA